MALQPKHVQLLREAVPGWVWLCLERTGGFIAGGFVRDVLKGDTPSDLDVFVPMQGADLAERCGDLLTYAQQRLLLATPPRKVVTLPASPSNPVPVQFIYQPGPLEYILSGFDFTVNSAAVGPSYSWCHEDFYAHHNARLLVIANDKALRAKRCLHRMFKLVARGYTIRDFDLARIISLVVNGAMARSGFVPDEERYFRGLLKMWGVEYDPEKGEAPPPIVGTEEAELTAEGLRRWTAPVEVAGEDYDPGPR